MMQAASMNTQIVPRMDAGGAALVAREVQQVQGMIVCAKNFPRDEMRALQKIEKACARPKLADAALYSYPKGGQTITGPSIRLAEVIAQAYGNLDWGWKEVEREAGASIMVAYCWDLESNVRRALEWRIPHVRDTKKGSYALTDEREIYELLANMAARRVRNCILASVPGDIVDAAEEACEKTMVAAGKIEEKVGKITEAFAKVEVTVEEIERRIGKKLVAMSQTDYVQLRKIWKSLDDGMSDKTDWFDPVPEPAKVKRESEAATAEDNAAHRALTLEQHRAAFETLVADMVGAGQGTREDILGFLGFNAEPDFASMKGNQFVALTRQLKKFKTPATPPRPVAPAPMEGVPDVGSEEASRN